MLPEAAEATFSRPRSQFFTKRTDQPGNNNIALGSEIRKQGRVTSPITISFYLAKNVKK